MTLGVPTPRGWISSSAARYKRSDLKNARSGISRAIARSSRRAIRRRWIAWTVMRTNWAVAVVRRVLAPWCGVMKRDARYARIGIVI